MDNKKADIEIKQDSDLLKVIDLIKKQELSTSLDFFYFFSKKHKMGEGQKDLLFFNYIAFIAST